MKPNTPQDFWRFVSKSDGCWVWTGAIGRRGYGYFKFLQKMYRAHRFAWRITKGDIPKGAFVLHRCDNPPCVNPDHLFLGTHQDNMDDMVAKGRATGCPQFGEDAANSKLTEAQVLEIRALKAAGEIYPNIRKRFGIAHNTAWSIVNRRTWRHI